MPYVPLATTPITRDQAKAWVAEHHRHNKAGVATWRFGTALVRTDTDEIVGVGIAGNCSASEWDKQGGGHFIEVRRVATDGVRNGCSMLYGALCRAAKALGFCTAWTFTLESESGASLKAAGWEVYAKRPKRKGWSSPSRPRDEAEWPAEAKLPLDQAPEPVRRARAQPSAPVGGSGMNCAFRWPTKVTADHHCKLPEGHTEDHQCPCGDRIAPQRGKPARSGT